MLNYGSIFDHSQPCASSFNATDSRNRGSVSSNKSRSGKLHLCPPRHSAFVTVDDRVLNVYTQVTRTFEFWRRVLAIWGSFKVIQVSIGVQNLVRRGNEDESWQRSAWDRQQRRAANMMLDLCTSMQGFYVKAGQFIALQAFVPDVIRLKLNTLHDDMPSMSAGEARAVLETELNQLHQHKELFTEPLDMKDSVIGSASIAQVHKLKLRENDERVAVKIQHKSVERKMMADLSNFQVLANLLQKFEFDFDLIRPVEELRTQVGHEFDFIHEANAMKTINHSLRNMKTIKIPRVYDDLLTKRMLVMEYIDGIPLTKLARQGLSKRKQRIVGRKLVQHLAEAYGQMILNDGYFHADCHPGNILIMNRKLDIGLLDFGQTKRLTETQRVAFARLVDAMARRHSKDIERNMARLGILVEVNNEHRGTSRSPLSVHEKLAYTMFDTRTVPGVSNNPFADDSALREATVTELPRDLMLLLRTTQILRGICKATDNDDFSIVDSWAKIARQQVKRHGRGS